MQLHGLSCHLLPFGATPGDAQTRIREAMENGFKCRRNAKSNPFSKLFGRDTRSMVGRKIWAVD